MTALIDHVKGEMGKPFVWGERDCLIFANEALRTHTGTGPFDRYLEQYNYDTRLGAIRGYADWLDKGGPGLIEEADQRFERKHTLHPSDGTLVGREVENGRPFAFSFGVVAGGVPVFVDVENGVTEGFFLVTDRFWSVA